MWFWRSGTDLGIDLGTATVLVYVKGKGILLKEPSVVAINKNNNKVLAVGEEARKMIGRTPGNIVAVRPLRDGVISDYDMTEKMLKEFIRKAYGKSKITAPKVIICVPSQATEVEKRAVIDAARNYLEKIINNESLKCIYIWKLKRNCLPINPSTTGLGRPDQSSKRTWPSLRPRP